MTQTFKKRIIWLSLVSAAVVLSILAFLKLSSSPPDREQTPPTPAVSKRLPAPPTPDLSNLSERARSLRSKLRRDPASAWTALNQSRGEEVDDETISLIIAAVFRDNPEKVATAIAAWPSSQASTAWRACMNAIMEQAKAGAPPVEILKTITLLPPHHAASDFHRGNLSEAFLAAGSAPNSLLEAFEAPDLAIDPELKKLFLNSFGQNPKSWTIPFEQIPPTTIPDFVAGRVREAIKGTSKWLADGFKKQPEARESYHEALEAMIRLDATRAYTALSQVSDPVFNSIVLAEMARAAFAEDSPEVARQWAAKISQADLKAEVMEELSSLEAEREN